MNQKQFDALNKKFGQLDSTFEAWDLDTIQSAPQNIHMMVGTTFREDLNNVVVILDPRPKELDLWSRFQHESLHKVDFDLVDDTIILSFKQSSDYTYHIISKGQVTQRTGLTLMLKMLYFMMDLYDHGVYIYPSFNSILIGYPLMSKADFDIQDPEHYEYTDKFFYLPIEEEISYKPVSEAKYLDRNYSFFNDLFYRIQEEMRFVDPNRDPATDPNQKLPYADNFKEVIDQMTASLFRRRWLYRHYRAMDEISPTPYIKVTQTLANDIVELINRFSMMHQPLSALFTAIDLLFRTGNLQGVDELIRAIYKDEFAGFRRDSLDVIAITKGKIVYNPVFDQARDLAQLVTFYKQIIISQPDLYPQVDIASYFRQMKSNNSDKNITIAQFFK